jgi:hypothetical protein
LRVARIKLSITGRGLPFWGEFSNKFFRKLAIGGTLLGSSACYEVKKTFSAKMKF